MQNKAIAKQNTDNKKHLFFIENPPIPFITDWL